VTGEPMTRSFCSGRVWLGLEPSPE
jgi:hypothetical protein